MKVKSLRQVHAAKMYNLDTPPIATYSMGAWYAIGAFEIDYTNDKMKIAWINSFERSAYRWVKIRYDKDGDDYIFTGRERRYLKDFY